MLAMLTKITADSAGLVKSFLLPLVPYAMIFYGLYLLAPWAAWMGTGALVWLDTMAESYWSTRRGNT